VVPETGRGEANGNDAGLILNAVGSLTSLVADIASRGTPRPAGAAGKNATPAKFRRDEG
jgi:DNA repair protein RadA/Sms